MLRWSMTVVVSDEEKAHLMRQVGIGKASVSEPLMKRRNNQDDIRTGDSRVSGMSPGGCPLIGQAVSGVKAARARSAARQPGRTEPAEGLVISRAFHRALPAHGARSWMPAEVWQYNSAVDIAGFSTCVSTSRDGADGGPRHLS